MSNWPRNRDPEEAKEVRRAQLIARYGHTPEPIPHKQLPLVLAAAGIRGEIHPNDCIAYIYRTMGEARAWAQSNNKYHGNAAFGPFKLEGFGVVGVVDFRNQLIEHGGAPTDPSLPDNTQPPPRKPKRSTQNGKKA